MSTVPAPPLTHPPVLTLGLTLTPIKILSILREPIVCFKNIDAPERQRHMIGAPQVTSLVWTNDMSEPHTEVIRHLISDPAHTCVTSPPLILIGPYIF